MLLTVADTLLSWRLQRAEATSRCCPALLLSPLVGVARTGLATPLCTTRHRTTSCATHTRLPRSESPGAREQEAESTSTMFRSERFGAVEDLLSKNNITQKADRGKKAPDRYELTS